MAPEIITPEQRALDGITRRAEYIFHLMAQKRQEADLSRAHADRADEAADDYRDELDGLNAIRQQLLLGARNA